MVTSGTVGGYRLSTNWFRSYAPFSDYLVPGLILLLVIGVGGVLVAIVNVVDRKVGSYAALAYGLVLVGWIAGELFFLAQTMVLTWVILGAGVFPVVLGVPRVVAFRGSASDQVVAARPRAIAAHRPPAATGRPRRGRRPARPARGSGRARRPRGGPRRGR